MEDKNLTVAEVAEILKVSKQTIWLRCKQGELPAFKMPGSRIWLINSKDLEKLQKKQKEQKKHQYEDK